MLLISRTLRCFLAVWPLLLMPDTVDSSAVLIADFTMSRMIALSSKYPFCALYKDKGDIQRMLLAADQRRIRQVPRESVLALEAVCHDSSRLDVKQQGGLGFIYPGTKWCGPGNIAANFDDLGHYKEEDRCCREHDFCPNTLAPGECRKGLCNTGRYTRSHCDCDARFRRCLQSLNTETANTLGAVFFNVVQVICFRERSPCSVWQRFEHDPNNYQFANACTLAFQASEFFIPHNDRLIASAASKRFLLNGHNARSLEIDDINEVVEESNVRLGVKFASIGLVARNLFKEAIRAPLDGLFGLIHRVFNPPVV